MCKLRVPIRWLAGFTLFLHSPMLSAETLKAPVAQLVFSTGKVSVEGKDAKAGDAIEEGQKIETGENSRARLLLVDKSIIDLGPSSGFRIKEAKLAPEGVDVNSTLEWGSVRAAIHKRLDKKSKFILRTKASVLAVRGTEFIVQLDRKGKLGEERVSVTEGAVDVHSYNNPDGPGISLPSGKELVQSLTFKGTEAIPTGAPRTYALTASAMYDLIKRNTVEDQTFHQAVVISESPAAGAATSHGGDTLTTLKTTFLPTAPPDSAPPQSRVRDLLPPNPLPPVQPPYLSQITPTITSGAPVKLTVTFIK